MKKWITSWSTAGSPVTFTTGRVYEYYMVPATIASAFKNAFSKGTFFNKRIRDKYVCREVTPAVAAVSAG